ncbi:acetylglutamate kinase [Nitriliruptoria bacterium AS10]|nr:acetylglutamate kinase [Salsipaludibacter albus]MBY5163794.1 acetylglutamate kinase [Salsipaludibacter albus]
MSDFESDRLTTRESAAQHKAAVLREALPWITQFHGSTVVIKYGGNAMVDAELKQSFAADVALMHFVGLRPVIVHGGGPQISALANRLGIESTFVDGLRITDDAMMDVVRMALLGEVNPELVGLVERAGAPAVGVAGTDAGLLTVTPATSPGGTRLGRVGDVASVDTTILDDLLDDGFLPVVATAGRDEHGVDHNVNADLAAGAIAGALGAAKLIYLTDVPGLYLDFGDAEKGIDPDRGSLIGQVTPERLREMLDHGDLHSGMLPKVRSVLAALDAGVPQAHLLDGRVRHAALIELFTDEGIGTMVSRGAVTASGLTFASDHDPEHPSPRDTTRAAAGVDAPPDGIPSHRKQAGRAERAAAPPDVSDESASTPGSTP